MADEAPELKWDGSKSAAWSDEVERWPWRSAGDGDWAKSGDCPRCNHGITVVKSGGVVAEVAISETSRQALIVGANDRSDEGSERSFFGRCNCGVEHPSRPPELARGCGGWGFITEPPES